MIFQKDHPLVSECSALTNSSESKRRVSALWVISEMTAGGIGPVCRYAAEGVAQITDWRVTLLSLHDPCGGFSDESRGARFVSLGLDGNCARLFLQWLAANPQDLIITSDVPRIEPAFRFLPPATRHVAQIHDSARRYRDVAVRHASRLDGVTCVGRHIEAPLRRSLQNAGFHGLLDSVHNGAAFPAALARPPHTGPIRLVFIGRMDPFKGIFDLAPILARLDKLRVPAHLTIVGGKHDLLMRSFSKNGIDHLVSWKGLVPHEECYRLAAESDVLLMPSRKEAFGMVTIEAMSMGCVPIAYNFPSGSTEIIEDKKSGLLVPLGDYAAWAAAIEALHHDRKRLAELSAGAAARARGSFNMETMSKKLASFLGAVLTHAEIHPAKRESGLPPETPATYTRPSRGYQRLPAWLRGWIRNRVGARPRLSHWLLNR
jgi:glycosyltransferase involved in cell wall biosynthesis